VAGTAVDEHPLPTKGRILLFSLMRNKLNLLSAYPVAGGVMGLCQFRNMLLALINTALNLFSFRMNLRPDRTISNADLHLASMHHSDKITLPTCIDASNEVIVIGDLITSVSIYSYIQNSLHETSFHPYNLWTNAIHVFDDENIIVAAEESLLTFVVEKGKMVMQPKGMIYLGQRVNKFVKGSLVMAQVKTKYAQQAELVSQFPKSSQLITLLPPKDIPTLIYATGNGSIGIIGVIPKTTFNYLIALKEAIVQNMNYMGNLSYNELKEGKGRLKFVEETRFVNGDLVEILLKMDKKMAEDVYNKVQYNPKPTFRDTLVLLRQLSLIH